MARIALLITLCLCLAVPVFAQFGADDLSYDIRVTGTVTDLNYGIGDFILRERNQSYVVLADAATVQLNGGKFGTLMDLKDHALVRVFGDKLSSRTIYANVIIVLEDTGRYVDLSLSSPKYLVGDEVEIEGIVTHVSVRANDITFHTLAGNFALVPRFDTLITRGGFRTDIYGVYRGDRIRVTGRLTGRASIDPDRIQIIDSCCLAGGPIDRFWNARIDIIMGVVVYVPTRPTWMFTVRTPFGVRSVRLAAQFSGAMLSIQEIRVGSTVQLTGIWDSRTLVANRFTVLKTDDKKQTPPDKKPTTGETKLDQKAKPADPKSR